MTYPVDELIPENIQGWPATPSEDRLEQAFATFMTMQAVGQMTTSNITIPALLPQEERPQDILKVESPWGACADFDMYHNRHIVMPDNIVMKEHKVRNAMGLHNCMQASAFSQACISHFADLQPRGAEQIAWFNLHTASLGDSDETIGLVIDRPSASRPGKTEIAFTKLSRYEHWMGYNINIQHLAGLTCHVVGAQDVPHLPSYVLACPSEVGFPGPPGTTLKPGQKTERQMLAKIFKYHGADKCLWHPYDPDQD